MSYARVIVAGQWHYYDNVERVWSEEWVSGEYLHIQLSAHPSLVHFWREYRGGPTQGYGSRTSVLLAATVEDYIALLQEEDAARRLHKEDA